MDIDKIGHAALYQHMLQNGYTGTLEVWASELQKTTYSSQIRVFLSYYAGDLGLRHPLVLPWLQRICSTAEKRFDRVQTQTGWSGRCHILFGLSTAPATPTPKLSLEGLRITLEPNQHDLLEVRIQAYGPESRSKEKTIFFKHRSQGGRK